MNDIFNTKDFYFSFGEQKIILKNRLDFITKMARVLPNPKRF